MQVQTQRAFGGLQTRINRQWDVDVLSISKEKKYPELAISQDVLKVADSVKEFVDHASYKIIGIAKHVSIAVPDEGSSVTHRDCQEKCV